MVNVEPALLKCKIDVRFLYFRVYSVKKLILSKNIGLFGRQLTNNTDGEQAIASAMSNKYVGRFF